MADWTFDAANKLILEPTSSGDTSYNVQRDLYSAWKRQVNNGSLAGVDPAFRVEGGEPIGSTGRFTGTSQVLINGWKLRGADRDHQITLSGNLYSSDGNVSSANPSFSVSFELEQSASAQGISTGSGVTAQDVTDITNSVFQYALEGSFSFAEVVRLIVAESNGNTVVGPGNSIVFRDLANTKDRIVEQATASGERTVSTRDGV